MNPRTRFIWAFIAPVIVITVINVAFFIMAAVILWRQSNKKVFSSDVKHVKKWLRALVSLVVVMGLTWIVGVMIVEVEGLVPLVYVYNILVAFQGVWIFSLFVVFDQQVQEGCAKLWKTKVKKSDLFGGFKNTGIVSPYRWHSLSYIDHSCILVACM